MDWFLIVLDYVGVENIYGYLEGWFLWDVFEKDVFLFYEYLIWEGFYWWVVCKGDWKLLYVFIDLVGNIDVFWELVVDGFFLVNLMDDVGELENVID